MNYLSTLKNVTPYLLILGVILYIYIQDLRIENLKENAKKDTQKIEILEENIKIQEQIFNDRLKKIEFKTKFLEQKNQIEKGLNRDEKDINKSIPNRFYIAV
ncbi:hypothetical protein H0A43_07515 [Arcobacter lanthieri]|uniref:hypothetical protein n=1 Tax=Aliarcobacter lanthieri TaxID=1355374 RepID=UPI0019242068|nr:hypothetical protein [Aliarcobacter lanthieri]MBL3520320.1 hypothetical protein [Aliarcobacter lanthieri]